MCILIGCELCKLHPSIELVHVHVLSKIISLRLLHACNTYLLSVDLISYYRLVFNCKYLLIEYFLRSQ